MVEVGLYCNRVNDNGVDLNRNWNDHWKADSDHSDTHPGISAFSEDEVRIIAAASHSFQPTIFFSFHSGSLNMLSPFAYTSQNPSQPHGPVAADGETDGVKKVLTVLSKVNHDFCRCRTGTVGAAVSTTSTESLVASVELNCFFIFSLVCVLCPHSWVICVLVLVWIMSITR